MRPLPQPPTRSLADRWGTDTLGVGGAIPAVTTPWKAGLVCNDPAALLSDQVTAVAATINSKKLMRHIGIGVPEETFDYSNLEFGESTGWVPS